MTQKSGVAKAKPAKAPANADGKGAKPKTSGDKDSKPEAEKENEPKPEAENGKEPKSEAENGNEPKSEAENGTEPEPEAEKENEAKPEGNNQANCPADGAQKAETCDISQESWKYCFSTAGWAKLPESMINAQENAASFYGIHQRLEKENLKVYFSRSFSVKVKQ